MLSHRLILAAALAVWFASSNAPAQQRSAREIAPAIFPPLAAGRAAEKERILSGVRRADPADARPPNIVLLLADDLGYADVGCYGSTAIPTPNIDAIAEQGMRFTDAYVTAGTCSPSRAALLTGRYQQRFGFEFNTGPVRVTQREGRGLDPAAFTIADVLQRAGYATGMVGKWHQGTRAQFHPQQRGFDAFFGFLGGAHIYLDPARLSAEEKAIEGGAGSIGEIFRGTDLVDEPDYLTDAFAREAASFIDRHHDQPFFLYVPFNAVHTPIQATEKYRRRFADVEDLKRRTYYAMTSAMDDAVGRILAALESNRLSDNTLVIFFNDNGGPMYTGVQDNGPLRLGKLFLFEGGVRVPLIMRWPQVIAPHGLHSEVVSALDLFPTICSAAGVELPDDLPLDGVDLRAVLEGRSGEPSHEALFWRNGPNRAVRKGRWKMVEAGRHVWLFDLTADVGETRNLATERPDVVADLMRSYADWESELPPPAWPPRPDSRTVEVDGVPYQLAI